MPEKSAKEKEIYIWVTFLFIFLLLGKPLEKLNHLMGGK